MQIGLNNLNQIKQIREIADTTLAVIELDETAELYPFKGWSDVKILCYCYKDDGNGTSIYPYIDTGKIQEFDGEVLELQAQVIELEFEKITGGTI